MALNLTSAFLEAKQSMSIMLFSGAVTTTSVSLAGGGGMQGCGFSVPLTGYAKSLFVYDGTSVLSCTGVVTLTPGDRLSLYATYSAGTFAVELIRNGNPTGMVVGNCAANTNLYATLLMRLKEG